MRLAFAAIAVLGLMILMLLSGRDRSIDLANALVQQNRLKVLSADEEQTLQHFLDAFLSANGVKTDIAINKPYEHGRINLFVVDANAPGDGPITRGNAAYIPSSDILFIERAYFEFGGNSLFADAGDELTNKTLAPLRVHAFFVLAHELGHRALGHGRGWFDFPGAKDSYAREIEADDYAVESLEKLYGSAKSRVEAGIPEPISGLGGFSGKPATALGAIADHFGYSVSFLSDDIFDSPFPILTGSGTHPAFFARLRSLLTRLKAEAESTNDEDALRSLSLAEAVVTATDYLISQSPVEVEFSNLFQYAYLDKETLYVVGNDSAPILRIPLSELKPGGQYNREMPLPQEKASIRYAWPGRPNEAMTLRTDGHVSIVALQTGKALKDIDLKGQLGDDSCVKEFTPPAGLRAQGYASYCIALDPTVSVISVDGSIATHRLVDVAMEARQAGGDHNDSAIEIKSLGVDAAGRATLVYAVGGQLFCTTLSDAFKPGAPRKLAFPADAFPGPDWKGETRINPKAFVFDAGGKPHHFYGTPIFRDIGIFDAESNSDTPVASIDQSPSVSEENLAQVLPVLSSFPIGLDRQMINLGQPGAYLMDFGGEKLLPVRRSGFEAMEQVLSNFSGDWIYYRKYSNRILLFRGQTK